MLIMCGLATGCSDVEDSALEAYQCAKAADAFNDSKMSNNATWEFQKIIKEGNVGNSSELIRNIGQQARDEYEPYGSSTPDQLTYDVYRDWYDSGYCKGLKEEGQYEQMLKVAKERKFAEQHGGVDIDPDAVPRYSAFISTSDDMIQLQNFIDKNQGNVVNLQLSACPETITTCSHISINDKRLSFSASYTENDTCDYLSDLGSGISIDFVAKDNGYFTAASSDSGLCDLDNTDSQAEIDGLFFVKDNGWAQGWTIWNLVRR